MATAMAAVNPFPHANPASDAGAQGGSASGEAATISANDFLTLLVTEMKNQDPTAQTDPNEYINQLVQVNSLEQLIQINQELSTAAGSTNTGGAGSTQGHAIKAAPGHLGVPPSIAQTNGGHPVADFRSATPPAAAHGFPAAPGNLSVPLTTPAARRIANALSGGR
jgi:flagellar basal-body rod modification protein FlgD